mmetsp:Transcript_46433/g.124091  ORF Transcript_46433/g.124091 Transcript_46433/m.124091 type:complete len:394 (-) Transcript_46433:779-1960(-)
MLEEDATQHPEVGRRVLRLEAAELQAQRATQRSLGRTLTLCRSAAVGLSAASGVLLQFASLPHHRVRADGAIRLRLDLLLNLLPSCCRPWRSGALGHAPSRHREGKSGGSTLAALGTSGSASCHARHREREASGAGRHAGILTRHREATKAEGLLGRGVVVRLRTLAWRTRHGEREASVEAGHRKKERRHRELLRPSGIAGEGRLLGRRCLGLVGAATAATATADLTNSATAASWQQTGERVHGIHVGRRHGIRLHLQEAELRAVRGVHPLEELLHRQRELATAELHPQRQHAGGGGHRAVAHNKVVSIGIQSALLVEDIGREDRAHQTVVEAGRHEQEGGARIDQEAHLHGRLLVDGEPARGDPEGALTAGAQSLRRRPHERAWLARRVQLC